MAAALAWPELPQFLLLSLLGSVATLHAQDRLQGSDFLCHSTDLGSGLAPPGGRMARSGPDKVLLPGTVVE